MFRLHLDPNPNARINDIILFESVDITVIDKLIHSNLLLKTVKNSFTNIYYSNEREQLMEYYKLIKNGKACVQYEKPNIFGRVYPKRGLSLFCFRREIRHTLAKGLYIDVDIKNCHYDVIYQICKKNKIQCNYVEDYVKNRDKYLNKIIKKYNVSRGQAKELFIIILCGGSFNTWCYDNNILSSEQLQFITDLKENIDNISKTILIDNPDIVSMLKKKKNISGTVLSFFLQEIECGILYTIFSYCIDNNIITNLDSVLCADGIMIEINNYTPELLAKFNEIIKLRHGFSLTFEVKDMNESYLDILDNHIMSNKEYEIELLDGYNNEIFINNNEEFSFSKLKDYFFEDYQNINNKKFIDFFHLSKSFKYFDTFHAHFYINNSIYQISKNKNRLDCFTDFDLSFEQLHFTINKSKHKFTTLYNECKFKKTYSTFDFQPNKKETDDTYNLFKGFVFDDDDLTFNQDTVDIYLNLIKYICKDEKDEYQYVINWLAHIIQKPAQKTNVALVFFSDTEGVGKNFMFDIYEKLLEGYCNKFKDTNSINERFNGDMMGKLFVIGDEIKGRTQEISNELKDIITRKKEVIEYKNKDKIIVNDYKNYAFTTNNQNVFKISITDRRYVFIECTDIPKPKSYYERLAMFRDNKSELKQLYNFFKTYDISKFNPAEIITNKYKQDLIVNNLESYIKFVIDEIDDLKYGPLTTQQLYKMSIQYARRNKMVSTYTMDFFNKKFKSIFANFNSINSTTKRSEYNFKKQDKESITEHIKSILFN